MTEDEKQIFRIQHFGSESAKEQLIRSHYNRIYAYAYRRTHSAEDAMDVTQEIFIKVIKALPTFDRKKASFRTWLYTIASNTINDYFRGYQVSGELNAGIPSEERFEEIAENKALAARIMDYLRRSDYTAFQVVELKIFAELTFDEIGKQLSLSPNTVKTKYYTAIKKCRKEFTDDEH